MPLEAPGTLPLLSAKPRGPYCNRRRVFKQRLQTAEKLRSLGRVYLIQPWPGLLTLSTTTYILVHLAGSSIPESLLWKGGQGPLVLCIDKKNVA
ncbi:hypothetical protein CI102_5704 [Trichoderma harzianum]|nr:hypothetical protein CI102_5704 [Trichoderma harzianum]